MKCMVCGRPDEDKPMCFQGEAWCCELHRKLLAGQALRQEPVEEVPPSD